MIRDPGSEDVVVVPVEDSLDLHFFLPRDIPSLVEEYLASAREAGLREVRLIHGRGKGIQKARVQALVSRLPGVLEVREATPDRGGWGATVVELEPPNSSESPPAP